MGDLATLVRRACDGDSQAFGALVRRFQDMAVGYGYAMLTDLGWAEDAAQEAFLEAYLCLPQLREPAAFPGWFKRIVFKQCDRLRRGKFLTVVPLEMATEKSAPVMNQLEAIEQREMKDQVWSAIDLLPEHERTAVVLCYFGGHSQKEVAAFLELPVTTIKKRLFSARRHLREMLTDVVSETLREQRPSRDETFAASVMEMLAAARVGDTVRVKQLFQQNRQLLTARDWLGNTALIMAVNSGHQAVAELLFNAGVRADIHEAAAIGQTDHVRALLNEDPVRLDSFSAEGFTPVTLASHFGRQETLTFLIDRGANINIVSQHPLQVTPLHAALFGQQTAAARLLIEQGADVNIKRGGYGWPRAGWTALHYAASYGLIELIEPILLRTTDINLRDDEGQTALDVAIEAKQEAVAALLREHGAEDTHKHEQERRQR